MSTVQMPRAFQPEVVDCGECIKAPRRGAIKVPKIKEWKMSRR